MTTALANEWSAIGASIANDAAAAATSAVGRRWLCDRSTVSKDIMMAIRYVIVEVEFREHRKRFNKLSAFTTHMISSVLSLLSEINYAKM
ncbi:unnamed protein product [Toxocara canis]|uniref:Secreted protein n=1 Tax=Toxocara canis TaxID=6265 RepID=A0A183UAJ4_TOXCA|nr:unnamed protein product [Toxocara canis]